MKRQTIATALTILVLILTGAGCQNAAPAAPASGLSSDGGSTAAAAPADAWSEFETVAPLADGLSSETFGRTEGSLTVSVPSSWKSEGAIWRPDDGKKLNHIRVAHFSSQGPMTAWEEQKKLDVHVVVRAEERNGAYLLMVNHPTLKATIFKVFIPDPAAPGDAYYFFECRAAYEGDRAAIWSACKAAYESLKIE